MHPRKFVRDAITIAGSQYVVRLMLLVRGVVAARLLGPSAYGAWNALSLLLEYGTQAPAGTLQGLDQAVPGRIVDGDAQRLERIKRAGLFNILVLGLLFSALTLGYFVRSEGQIRGFWGLTGVTVALLCALLTNVATYHTTLLRSHGDMAAVGTWFLIQGVVGAIAGIALIPLVGAWGLLWGWTLGTLLSLAYVRWRGRAFVTLAPLASTDSAQLLTIGFPMFLYVGLGFVMRTLDRIIILRFLSTEALGYYSLAVMALGMLLYLPDSVAYVLYPKILRAYRETADNAAAIRPMVQRTLLALSLVLPALCAIAYLAADDAVDLLLPKFRAGVPSLRILCFGAAALGLGSIASIVLMTLRRQLVLVPIGIAIAGLGVMGTLTAIREGFGIRGVAWAMLGTYSVHSMVLLLAAFTGLEPSLRRRFALLPRLFVPLLVAIPLAHACNTLAPWRGSTGWLQFGRLLLSTGAFCAIYLALMAPLARGIGLLRIASEFEWPWLAARRGAGAWGGGGR